MENNINNKFPELQLLELAAKQLDKNSDYIIKSNEVIDKLLSALCRTTNNFVNSVQGKPVRDMAETLAEGQTAVKAVLELRRRFVLGEN